MSGRLDLIDVRRDEEDQRSVSAHELAVTVPCKVAGCEEVSEDRRGRYAGLCPPHKQAAIEKQRAEMRERSRTRAEAGEQPRTRAELAIRVELVKKAARKLERAETQVEAARYAFRREWLLLGAAAGVLPLRKS